MYTQAKIQNVVPHFLLKNFSCDDGEHTWCYDKPWRKIEEKKIRDLSNEPGLYPVKGQQHESNLERSINKMEMNAAPVIRKVIDTRSLGLSADERSHLCLFMALHLSHIKTALKHSDTLSQQLNGLATILAEPAAVYGQPNSWLPLFEVIPDLATILDSKLWFLLSSDKQFYTSDNPVVKQNTAGKYSNRSSLGLNADGIEIYFPLSDSLLLCLLCERSYGFLKNSELLVSPANIENMNALQIASATRFVFSSGKSF